jgi:hypothetical protein
VWEPIRGRSQTHGDVFDHTRANLRVSRPLHWNRRQNVPMGSHSTSIGIFDSLRYFRAIFSLIPDFNAATPNDIARDNNFFKRRTWPSRIIAALLLETDCDLPPRPSSQPAFLIVVAGIFNCRYTQF